jgi:hypothetical protein
LCEGPDHQFDALGKRQILLDENAATASEAEQATPTAIQILLSNIHRQLLGDGLQNLQKVRVFHPFSGTLCRPFQKTG